MANSRKPAIDRDPLPEQAETPAGEPLVEILHIDGNLPGDFRLSRPLRIEVWIENDEFVADAADLDLHAFGATRQEALENVRSLIVEQRQRIDALRGHLSPLMQMQAVRLAAIVLPRHA
ncbi:MAG: hypothetical protein ACRDJC_12710 [Thermomicrobiales bacterium]